MESKDCGPTCLRIISRHYDRNIPIQYLRSICETTKQGTSLLNISDSAESIGFRTLGLKASTKDLSTIHFPCLLHWNSNHYVVLYKIKKGNFYVSDPAHGLLVYNKQDFERNWIGQENIDGEGILLQIEPTPKFYENSFNEDTENPSLGFRYLSKYLIKYKSYIFQLVLGLLAGSILQLFFPFLTQSVVDVGIKNQDIHFVYLILIAQLSLFLGRTCIDILRSWILLHLSTRINISLISDFFIKLTSLPISFFDTRMTGDLMQRISDHKRIESILTTSSLSVLFSMVNVIVFGFVLMYYSLSIFSVFILGSVIYFLWIAFFLKRRKALDYKKFSKLSKERSSVIEMINGMQEIKLHNAEKKKRWNWEYLQIKLFKVSIEALALEQYQSVGSKFINEFKNISITILSATLVINGEITLGMMLAISYIVGQLNSPISLLINFVREIQDARISLDRLSEIHKIEDEEIKGKQYINEIPAAANIAISDLSYRYTGQENYVLKGLNLVIPGNQVTAIVGTSGSGKTTLMKLLLKFYEPQIGEVTINNFKLSNVSPKVWRENCGVVMQEGYIFNDTIANNIAIGEDFIDKEKLENAVNTANIKDFIESLPLSYNTQIGMKVLASVQGKSREF